MSQLFQTRHSLSFVRVPLTLVSLLTMAGCERVVDLQVDEGPKRLVVEARLERVKERVTGAQQILLSTTSPYFAASAPPAARGAIVRVTDEAGKVTVFPESATPGVYTSSLVIEVGKTYGLTIDYAGARYEASERAVPVARIDSLYFDAPKPGRFAGTEGVRATLAFADPANEKNFYLWDQFVDGVRQLGPDSAFRQRVTAPDDCCDGLPVLGFQPYEGVVIKPGSDVLLRQIGLSEQTYRYYRALSDQVSNDGSPFGIPAASVRGNVANRTDPSRFPIGYFAVSEVSEARRTRPR